MSTGLLDSISGDYLEETVTAILSDIDVKANDIEACHRIGQSDKNKSKETIIHFMNRKQYRKILKNKKNQLTMTSPNINFQ